MISRANFLRLVGLAGAGWLCERRARGWQAGREGESQGEEWRRDIEKLMAETLVFDGTLNLGTRRGKGGQVLAPGEVKRLTGIDIINYSMRVAILERTNRLVEEHRDALMKIERARDIKAARSSGRCGLIYYVQQGFDLKGSVEPLSEWKSLGLRSLQLTYSSNDLGGGTEADDMPLSTLGKRVVKELNRLRMVVDVSHSGRRTTLDAAAESSHPITANHANSIHLTPHRRNKTDEELKAIAATGGVIGITGINRFLLSSPATPATLDDFVNHIDYVVNKVGIDHVGISSDSYMDGSHRYDVDFSEPRLCSFERWMHVARRLQERGYKREDIEKILGRNFQRVYETVLDP